MDIKKVSDEKYIYLTTKGRKTGNPHTVELWFALAGGRIYLSHEGEYTDWMKNIVKDKQVTFKIGDVGLEGRARIFRHGDEFETGKHALYTKYIGKAEKEVVDDWFSLSKVIEIILD